MGRILLRDDVINPGDTVPVQLQLEEPVAVLPGDFYVIRSYSPVRTIGGGRVLHPVPRKRKRSRPELWDEMRILVNGSDGELINYHIRQSGLRGLDRDEVAVRTGLYGKPLAREIERLLGGRVVIKADSEGRLVHSDVYEGLKGKITGLLEGYHSRNPLVAGLAKEELRSRLFPSSGQGGVAPASAAQRLFQKALGELEKKGLVAVEKELVRLADHEVALGEKESGIREGLERAFRKAGLQPPSASELMDELSESAQVSRKSVEDIFSLLVREGTLVRLRDNINVHPRALEDIEKRVVSFLEKNEEMGVGDFRELAGGISRKYMIPLLEYLDNKKTTLRIGDVRRLRKSG
jgi:selenocysteine-specific elongation factor